MRRQPNILRKTTQLYKLRKCEKLVTGKVKSNRKRKELQRNRETDKHQHLAKKEIQKERKIIGIHKGNVCWYNIKPERYQTNPVKANKKAEEQIKV